MAVKRNWERPHHLPREEFVSKIPSKPALCGFKAFFSLSKVLEDLNAPPAEEVPRFSLGRMADSLDVISISMRSLRAEAIQGLSNDFKMGFLCKETEPGGGGTELHPFRAGFKELLLNPAPGRAPSESFRSRGPAQSPFPSVSLELPQLPKFLPPFTLSRSKGKAPARNETWAGTLPKMSQ